MLLVATLALVFLLGAGAVTLLALKPEPKYRPGERLEGLTAELARSLPPDYPRVTFQDVTQAAGISFRHFWGSRTSQIPEDMGSGAAWGDYDNDGWMDLFVVNLVGPITLSADEAAKSPATAVLYHNNGDGTFTDVTTRAGVGYRGWGMGAWWGDYDNDGWPDLFVTSYGENVLYHNHGDGTFTDVTRRSGAGGKRGFWAGAAWGDYDQDGWLDLYVTGYVQYSYPADLMGAAYYDAENPASINPNTFDPERNLLYHNNGDGTFTEVAAGARVLGEHGKGLGAVWADLDEDGWPDLYVANDVSDNQLFYNLGNGTFRDISHLARVADYRSAMGLAIGDWDGDQDLDIFITHWIAQENALYDNQRDRTASGGPPAPFQPGGPEAATRAKAGANQVGTALVFMDEADRFGVGQIALDYVGWGTFFFDYDNDGRLDLFVVNGHTFQQRDAPALLVPQHSQLFWNRGAQEGFYDVGAVSGEYFRQAYVGRGAAFADYDNDGDLDVFVVNHGGPAVLLRNQGGNRRSWLQVKLEGRQSNRSAMGAKLRLVAGRTVQIREVGAQAPYLSQNSLIEHFGLGNETQADSLVVSWPSGVRQVFTGLRANQVLHVVEGVGGR